MSGLHLGALLALNPAWFSWSGLALCFLLHWITGGIGICMTYHRLLTHRSFALRPRWLEYLLTIIGTCASEGGAIGWVSDHRRHHANSDEEHDTHTPKEGFFWAHMYWWMILQPGTEHSPEYYQKWAPDLNRDPVHRVLERIHILFPILLFIGLYAAGGMSWLVWGGFVRTIFVLHSTWLVNSATHIWGYRSHPTRDHSTNLWWVALSDLRRGLAQQPPCLPDVRAARPEMVGVRCDLDHDLADESVRDRLQHQAGQDPGACRPCGGRGRVTGWPSAVPAAAFRLAISAASSEDGRASISGPSSTAEQGTHSKKGGSGG